MSVKEPRGQMIERRTITMPLSQARRLEHLAQQKGSSFSAVAREAIDAYLASQPAPTLPSFVGIAHSGRGDLSERVEEIIGEMIDAGEIP